MKKYTENHGMYDIGICMWDQIPQKTGKKKKKNYRISGFFAIFTLPYRVLRGVPKGLQSNATHHEEHGRQES